MTVCFFILYFCWLVLCWQQFWSQHWFPDDRPCCGSQNTLIWQTARTVNPALPSSSSPSRPPAPTSPKENKVFSMVSGRASLRVSWPAKTNNHGFSLISGRTPPSNFIRKHEKHMFFEGLEGVPVYLDPGSEKQIIGKAPHHGSLFCCGFRLDR